MSDVADRIAIHDLLARYSHTIDGGDYEAWIDCFTPEGSLVSAVGTSSGRDALRTFAKNYDASRVRMPHARHYMTNIACKIDGESATARSYVQITTSAPSGVRVLFTGQYDDRLIKQDGHWKFVERRGIPDTSIAETTAWREAQGKTL